MFKTDALVLGVVPKRDMSVSLHPFPPRQDPLAANKQKMVWNLIIMTMHLHLNHPMTTAGAVILPKTACFQFCFFLLVAGSDTLHFLKLSLESEETLVPSFAFSPSLTSHCHNNFCEHFYSITAALKATIFTFCCLSTSQNVLFNISYQVLRLVL